MENTFVLGRKKKKSCFRFPDRPIKIDSNKFFFSASEQKKNVFAYRLMCSMGKKYKSPTDLKSNELPKGREMNVLICFMSYILPYINFP